MTNRYKLYRDPQECDSGKWGEPHGMYAALSEAMAAAGIPELDGWRTMRHCPDEVATARAPRWAIRAPGVAAEATALGVADQLAFLHATAPEVTTAATVTLVSFGYLHAPAPAAHLTVDVRAHFRDPHGNRALRYLTAADPAVTRAVMGTPGITDLTDAIVAAASAFLAAPFPGPVAIAIGCAGGRHRAPVIAAEAARRIDPSARIAHRDIERSVVERHATA